MAEPCLLYYITDRTALARDEPTRCRRLLEKIAEATHSGVNYIQLREKDLPTRDLESLAREAMTAIRESQRLATDSWPRTTALLINSRSDVALAVNAGGVHLRSDDISPPEVRTIWRNSGVGTALLPCPAARSAAATGRPARSPAPLIAVSCHSPAEVTQAAASGATFAVFATVFEKKDASPTGLHQLHQACQTRIPVLALGGVTLAKAQSCLEAGAAGIAAIRLFQESDIAATVKQLRSISA